MPKSHHSKSAPADQSQNPYTTEVWRKIRRWPAYEVSSFGRIKSFWIRARNSSDRHTIGGEGRIRKLTPDTNGYPTVKLCDGSGVAETHRVSRLVLEAFVGPCPHWMEACHYPDPTPANCRLDNLRWDTRSGNMCDAVQMGTNNRTKTSKEEVEKIWARLVAGESPTAIAKDIRRPRIFVNAIKSGHTWSHYTKTLPGTPPSHYFTREEVEQIWARLVRGDSVKAIAKDFKVSVFPIHCIKNKTTYKEILDKLPGEIPPPHPQYRNKRGTFKSLVPAIWERLVAGDSISLIAKDFGVSFQLVSGIRTGRRHAAITSKLPGGPPPLPFKP